MAGEERFKEVLSGEEPAGTEYRSGPEAPSFLAFALGADERLKKKKLN